MKSRNKNSLLIFALIVLAVAECLIWQRVLFFHIIKTPREYFFDVGQGDSELVIFPGGVKILVDAGPDDAVVSDLQKALPQGDRYIDLAVISYPALANFNGFNFILDHYKVGAFLYDGRNPQTDGREWGILKNKLRDGGIPLITVVRGDVIHIDDGRDAAVSVLSPSSDFIGSADIAQAGLVLRVQSQGLTTLFTADVDAIVEDWLVSQLKIEKSKQGNASSLKSNVLKIAKHGSQYASSNSFLSEVNPDLAVIEFGAKGLFSAPSRQTLGRIGDATYAHILETDKSGTISISWEQGKMKVAKEK